MSRVAPIHRFIFSLVSLLLTSFRVIPEGCRTFLQPGGTSGPFRRLVHLSAVGLASGAQAHGVTSGLSRVLPLQGKLSLSKPRQSASWPPPPAPASPTSAHKSQQIILSAFPLRGGGRTPQGPAC